MNGDRVREIRKYYKLSQPEFAKRIKISNAYISQLETGEREMNDRMVQLISREFGVDAEWLKTGEGNMFIPNSDLTELIKSYGLDELDGKIIAEYLKLSPQHRRIIKAFISRMVN